MKPLILACTWTPLHTNFEALPCNPQHSKDLPPTLNAQQLYNPRGLVTVLTSKSLLHNKALRAIIFKHISWMSYKIWTWVIFRPHRDFELFVTFLWPFLSSFSGVLLGHPLSSIGGMLGFDSCLVQMVCVKWHPENWQDRRFYSRTLN